MPSLLAGLGLLSVAVVTVVLGLEIRYVTQRLERDEKILHALCTHGASSIGPVTLKNGRLVGATRAYTTGCAR